MNVPADDTRWPRTYRPRRVWPIALLALGVFFLLGACIPLAVGGRQVALVACSLATGAYGAVLVWIAYGLAFVERIVLHEDAIEIHRLGRRARTIRRSDVRGRRLVSSRPRTIGLELASGERSVDVRTPFEPDLAFIEWLAAIPDLDAEDRSRAEAELLGRSDLGATIDERARALEAARRWTRAMNTIAMAACAWALLEPVPYALALGVCAIVPCIGVATIVLGRGLYTTGFEQNDPRPLLIAPIFLPGLVLGLRLARDCNVIDHVPLWCWMPPLVLPLATLAARAQRARAARWGAGAFLSLTFAAHAWGVLVLVNCVGDESEGEVHRATVVARFRRTFPVRTWQIELGPWGPVDAHDHYDVTPELYDELAVGSEVCLRVRPGVLGARWHTVERCD